MKLSQVGKYWIDEKIGQGAMGEVFRARDLVLGRDVALKVVSEKLSTDEAHRQAFREEARAAAHLNHPNIITVHDFFEEQGVAYIAMELLDGPDLRELIEKGRVTRIEEKVAIMEQILDGLAFAHGKGVVHRDLKPGNVKILAKTGQVKIMDFGLASRAEGTPSSTLAMGTPYYMAPELVRGERGTSRSDIFAMGAVCYELLCGKRPFTGPTVQAILSGVVHREPEPLARVAPDVPAAVAAVVERALAKDAARRFADAGEMLQALRDAWEGEDLTAAMLGAAGPLDETPARALGRPLSASPDAGPQLFEALEGIDEYLADRVPPLMAADSVAAFAQAPIEGAAAEIWGWAVQQQKRQPDLPLADVLFHALHKLSVLGEFELVDGRVLLPFLREMGEVLAQACPPDERQRLRQAITHLGESGMVHSAPLEMLRRLPGEEPAPAPAPALANSPGFRLLSLLEQRLRREGGGAAGDPGRRRLVSQALTAAATQATSERELEGHLRRLRAAGVAPGAGQIFRSLGEGLPDWALPKDLASDTADLPPAAEVKAMRQIVSLPEDPLEVARRFRHLVNAATEQFNEGNLGGAVQMFGLASALVAEKKIEKDFADPIRARVHEALDEKRLRQYMERPHRHPQLQAVMAFFEASMGTATLLDQLQVEERRERRRLLLDLLVVQGDSARALALARLVASLETETSDFARRNWIYLLRLVPRPAAEAPEPEVDAVARFGGPRSPAFLVKEAVSHLGQIRHPHAVHALVGLLHAWETELSREEGATDEDGAAALDRIAAALARQGSPRGWRALVDHALSRRPELGATAARLAELGSQDLSSSPEITERLLVEVRESLPRGVLGRLVGRRDQDLPALVGALAGTRAPEVKAVLEEVARRFPAHEAGRAAARALESQAAAPAAPFAGLSGELEAYGLPAILHRLGQGRATGVLTLRPRDAAAPATFAFDQGRLRAARWARREGADAAYQVLERPFAGTFAFESGAAPAAAGAAALPALETLIKEGIRRATELRRTGAVVPEDARLEATGAAPSTVPDEPDYELVVALWERACKQVSVAEMEADLTADSFRIRHALAHWLEEGALRVATPKAEPGPAEPGA